MRYLGGAFVGALILLGSSVFAGWPKVGGGPDDPATIAASAAVGTCVTWTNSNATDLREVDCAQPHLFEVTGAADISGQYPASAPLPDKPTWQRVTQTSCAASGTAYLGKLDPNGRYMVGDFLTEHGWYVWGERELLAVVGLHQAMALPAGGGALVLNGSTNPIYGKPWVCYAMWLSGSVAAPTVSRKIFFEKGVFIRAVRHQTFEFASTEARAGTTCNEWRPAPAISREYSD